MLSQEAQAHLEHKQAQGQVVAETQVLETVVMEIIKGEIVCQIMKIKII